MDAETINHCRDLVRTHDRDRYLATLYASAELQPHLFGLYAFSAEIARIRYAVSEPQLGEIRLQWWRDTLASLADAPAHPVAKALAETTQAHNLPLAPLNTLIDAHTFDLYADKLPDLTSLEVYLGETQSSIFQLASLVVSPREANAELSGLAGVTYGLSRLLQNLADNAKFFPASVDDIQALAERRLAEARQQQLSGNLLPVFLPLSAAALGVRKAGRPVSALRRQWAIWRAASAEKF